MVCTSHVPLGFTFNNTFCSACSTQEPLSTSKRESRLQFTCSPRSLLEVMKSPSFRHCPLCEYTPWERGCSQRASWMLGSFEISSIIGKKTEFRQVWNDLSVSPTKAPYWIQKQVPGDISYSLSLLFQSWIMSLGIIWWWCFVKEIKVSNNAINTGLSTNSQFLSWHFNMMSIITQTNKKTPLKWNYNYQIVAFGESDHLISLITFYFINKYLPIFLYCKTTQCTCLE